MSSSQCQSPFQNMMTVSRDDFRKRTFITNMHEDVDCVVTSVAEWSKLRPCMAFFCAMFVACAFPPCFVALFIVVISFMVSICSLVFVEGVIMIIVSLVMVMTLTFSLFHACCSSVVFSLMLNLYKYISKYVCVKFFSSS